MSRTSPKLAHSERSGNPYFMGILARFDPPCPTLQLTAGVKLRAAPRPGRVQRTSPSTRRLLQNIEADVAVDQVDEPAVVERHVVALGRRAAAGGFGDEPADLLGGERVRHVDDPQAAAEPDRIDQRALRALGELVRAEAGARRAAERR